MDARANCVLRAIRARREFLSLPRTVAAARDRVGTCRLTITRDEAKSRGNTLGEARRLTFLLTPKQCDVCLFPGNNYQHFVVRRCTRVKIDKDNDDDDEAAACNNKATVQSLLLLLQSIVSVSSIDFTSRDSHSTFSSRKVSGRLITTETDSPRRITTNSLN